MRATVPRVDAPARSSETSPWLTIWGSPRATIRRIVDAEERPTWIPVVALAAVHQALVTLQGGELGGEPASAYVMPVLIGMLQIVFGVLVGPFLLAWVGGWFGGDADPSDIRQSVAWSYAPLAVTTVAWIPSLLGHGIAPGQIASDAPLDWSIALGMLGLAIGAIWSFVMQVVTLAEVQRFSPWRALLSILILVIPMLLLASL